MNHLVYCAGHGVGEVIHKEYKQDFDKNFLTIKVLTNGMKVLYPEDSSKFRDLSEKETLNKLYSFLKEIPENVSNATWNRRHREYLSQAQDNDIFSVANVLRDLMFLETKKRLCFGEKKMKDLVLSLLIGEVSLINHISKEEAKKEILNLFNE